MRNIEYGKNEYEIIYDEDKNNFIELLTITGEYLVHCRYDGGDQVMKTDSIHQAFIILGLLKYGYNQDKIKFTLELLLK